MDDNRERVDALLALCKTCTKEDKCEYLQGFMRSGYSIYVKVSNVFGRYCVSCAKYKKK